MGAKQHGRTGRRRIDAAPVPVAGRRTILLGLPVLGLAGCGAVSSGAAGKQEVSEASDGGGKTRTITDIEEKKVEVPAAPKRVVTLSERTLDGTVALGVTPVGTVKGRGQKTVPNYLVDKVGDVPVVGSVSQVNFETIANLKPDLILTDGSGVDDEGSLQVLSNIAPTYFAGYSGGDWQIVFGNVAQALDLEAEAKKVVSDYQARAKDVGRRLADAGYDEKTVSIVRWQGDAPSLILDDVPPGIAITDLGLKYPKNQDDMERVGHSSPISKENVSEIDADIMFFGTLGGSSVDNPEAGGTADVKGAEEALDLAMKTPGFADLHAVTDGEVIPVDGSKWTSTGGPLLMSGLIDDIEKDLLGDKK